MHDEVDARQVTHPDNGSLRHAMDYTDQLLERFRISGTPREAGIFRQPNNGEAGQLLQVLATLLNRYVKEYGDPVPEKVVRVARKR